MLLLCSQTNSPNDISLSIYKSVKLYMSHDAKLELVLHPLQYSALDVCSRNAVNSLLPQCLTHLIPALQDSRLIL